MYRLLACLLLATTSTASAADPEELSVGYLKRIRGRFGRDQDRIVTVNLGNNKLVTDAGLRDLACLGQLATLNLYGTAVTDAGLKELAAFKNLTRLNLCKTNVTDAGLKHLAGLAKLAALNLSETAVTGAGLKDLAGLPDLVDVGLRKSAATDAGLKGVAALRRVRDLDLRDTAVTDAGLRELGPLKDLTELSLPTVTDRTITALRAIDRLHTLREAINADGRRPKDVDDVATLYLSGMQLTDAGLMGLAAFKKVTTIYLFDNNVTADGVAAFRRARPGCTVSR